MSIREATFRDMRAMAQVCAAAFQDEELFGLLMHPHRKEFPEDFVAYWQRRLLSHWFDPNRVFLVGLDKVSGKIVGVAYWERQGDHAAVLDGSWIGYLGVNKLLTVLTATYLHLLAHTHPNRAASPRYITALEDSFPHFAHLWSSPSMVQNWYLDLLATHPDYHGQGLGKQLVTWGVEEADREGVPASVIAAKGKEGFYEKAGFVEVGRANVGELMVEGRIEGGAVMFREMLKS
ncbi:putative GNAT family acetyltransferase [Calycina marina]|uniref:GNAT family acetyltransferase n=1 Tax=Calycina marina TaxID=1763456 RepID=A0A9P7Z603_9HELO|nr:putative GNAT family acetyltransferase [Calycina marina]